LTKRATDTKDADSTGSPERKTSAVNEAGAEAWDGGAHPAPFNMRRRIGSTAYEVAVYFSAESGETMNDKILRLVRGGVVKSDKEEQK
jgi:hypothetical protein